MPNIDGIVVNGTTYGFQASEFATPVAIDGVGFNGNSPIIHYGVCTTPAATAEKTVTITGFTLSAGARIAVKFTEVDTSGAPTLNVSGTGAKDIAIYGTWQAGDIVPLVYDGTVWSASFASSYSQFLYSIPTATIVNSTTLGADGLPITGLSLLIKGSQSGTGTPAPDNVRTLVGYQSATLTAPNGDTTQFSLNNSIVTFPLYDADYNAATKEMTFLKRLRVFTDANWVQSVSGTYQVSIGNTYENVNPTAPYNTYGAADWMPIAPNPNNNALGFRVANGYLTVYGSHNISGITDLTSFKAYLSQHNLTIMLTRKTEYTTTIEENQSLESLDIRTHLGNNTFSCDAGDVSATIRLDPSLAYNNLANAIVALGGTV